MDVRERMARLLQSVRDRMWLVLGGIALGLPLVAGATPQLEYVGSFNVFDGPSYVQTPAPMSARQVAALLFGGSYSDYAISTVDSQEWTTVTHTAWLDGFGDMQYLMTPAGEDFYMAAPSGLYDDFPAYSAWVCDHADCVADGFDVNAGWDGFNYTNYVWRTLGSPVAIPEPMQGALLLIGLGAMWIARRRLASRQG
jgi:hypothetical protein